MAISWRMDSTILGISLLTIADASSFVSANNPSLFTVRSFSTAGGNKAKHSREDIYMGLGKAWLETIAVGFGGALITQSWYPLALPLAYMVLQSGWFKWGLDHPHEEGTDIAGQG